MKASRFVYLLLAVSLLTSLAAQQTFTRIRGTIQEEGGSPLPGVRVTLQGAGMAPVTVLTSNAGIFLFPSVRPGDYTIRAELGGFTLREVRNVRVTLAQAVNLNITLERYRELPPPPPPPVPSLDDMDAVIRQLPLGQILYNPPAEMIEKRTERVEARISQSLAEDLKTGLRGRGVPNVENIRVSSSMKASLAGVDFEILALSEPVQQVPSSGYTQWEWDAKPTSAGEKTLCLSVSAIFDTEHGPKTKSFPVMDRKIDVKVDPKIHHPDWEKILKYAGGVVGLIGGIIGIFKGIKLVKKKRRKPKA